MEGMIIVGLIGFVLGMIVALSLTRPQASIR